MTRTCLVKGSFVFVERRQADGGGRGGEEESYNISKAT